MMKLWCDNCKEAVEPKITPDSDFHGEVDTRCYERYNIYTCPVCGEEVYEDPGRCDMCGDPCDPERHLCECCSDVIRERIAIMAADLKVTNSIMMESLADYISEVA